MMKKLIVEGIFGTANIVLVKLWKNIVVMVKRSEFCILSENNLIHIDCQGNIVLQCDCCGQNINNNFIVLNSGVRVCPDCYYEDSVNNYINKLR